MLAELRERDATGEIADVLAALDTYRKTSPEMVILGRMIANAVPASEGSRP